MILVWIYFLGSLVLFLMAVYCQVLYVLGRKDAGMTGGSTAPGWLWVFIMAFGLLGILVSAPGAIFHQPDWFIDKVFWLISKL